MKNLKNFKLFESKAEPSRLDELKYIFSNLEDYSVKFFEENDNLISVYVEFNSNPKSIAEKSERYKEISDVLLIIERNIKKIEHDVVLWENSLEVNTNYIGFAIHYKSNKKLTATDIFSGKIDTGIVLDNVALKSVIEGFGLEVANITSEYEEDINEDPTTVVDIFLSEDAFHSRMVAFKDAVCRETSTQNITNFDLMKEIAEFFKEIKMRIEFYPKRIIITVDFPIDL